MKQISDHGGAAAALATMPLLALVAVANGSSVSGAILPVASGQVATTGAASTR